MSIHETELPDANTPDAIWGGRGIPLGDSPKTEYDWEATAHKLEIEIRALRSERERTARAVLRRIDTTIEGMRGLTCGPITEYIQDWAKGVEKGRELCVDSVVRLREDMEEIFRIGRVN